mmetsp:Transcript_83581/g.221759  ORF Transcript_83581/g.221759 Transcript_83581/m.221759 type:complete len:308 (-) Transcript_83581:75-998(-)
MRTFCCTLRISVVARISCCRFSMVSRLILSSSSFCRFISSRRFRCSSTFRFISASCSSLRLRLASSTRFLFSSIFLLISSCCLRFSSRRCWCACACACCCCCCCCCCLCSRNSLSICSSSVAARFLSCFGVASAFCPASSLSSSGSLAFACSALSSRYLRGSGSWAGAGRNCGMSSSLGITGPRRDKPENLTVFFFRCFSSNNFSSSSRCFSSWSRILRSLSSRIALRSTGGGPPMLSLISVRGADRSTGGAMGPTPIFARTASRCFWAKVMSSRPANSSGTGGESPLRRLSPISIVKEVIAPRRPF